MCENLTRVIEERVAESFVQCSSKNHNQPEKDRTDGKSPGMESETRDPDPGGGSPITATRGSLGLSGKEPFLPKSQQQQHRTGSLKR